MKEKHKVTSDEFAECLCLWLARHLGTERTKETAKYLGIDISKKDNLARMFDELFALNMWLIVHTCQIVFDDTDKRTECLDKFHCLVYEEFVKEEELDFKEWHVGLGVKYLEYYKARESEEELGPLYELTSVVNRNIFGELKMDIFVQISISDYIHATIVALEGLLKQYEVS